MKKKRLEFKYIIIIVIVIFLIFIAIFSYTNKTNRQLSKIEMVIKDVVLFCQKIVTAPFNYISDKVSGYIDLKNVREENVILKENTTKIESLVIENIELKRQIEKLKSELKIDYSLTDYTLLNASIISRNVGHWYNTITINKGYHDGIKENMIVINGNGLIGKVLSVSINSSVVQLVTTTSTNNKISVSISNGQYNLNGLLNGYNSNNNYLIVEGISNTENVHIDDYVYTSGLGGIFPSGILIGKIVEFDVDNYGLSKILKVKPSVNFDDINYVSVLIRKDNLE